MFNTSVDIDTDYVLWLETQIEHLKKNEFENLDLTNLIEELEALVRGEKSAVENLAKQIMIHLIFCEYWYASRQTAVTSVGGNLRRRHLTIPHWSGEIANFRDQLESKLTTNLKQHLEQNWEKLWKKAQFIAYKKSGLTINRQPYTLGQVLDGSYFPTSLS